jgi:hypothetical protein
VSGEELFKVVNGIANRLLEDVGGSGSRWMDLLETLPTLPVGQYELVIERLSALDADRLSSADREAIWSALRGLLSRHRSFPDAGWALPKERLDSLDVVYRRFEPRESATRVAWLFADSPQLPEGREGDWEAYQRVVESARLEAVRNIYAEAGIGGLTSFIARVERPFELGATLGKSELLEAGEDGVLATHLAADDRAQAAFARGFAAGRVQSRGRAWAEAKLTGVGTAWSPAQHSELLICMPPDGSTWDLAERLGAETERHYWRLVHPVGFNDTDVERVVRKLVEHRRPYSAIGMLGLNVRRVRLPPALVADALERMVATPLLDDPAPDFWSYYLSELRIFS